MPLVSDGNLCAFFHSNSLGTHGWNNAIKLKTIAVTVTTTTGRRHLDLLNPEYCSWLGFLEQSENWGVDQIQQHQTRQLQRVAFHAYSRMPAYRQRFEAAGMRPEDIQVLDHIKRLPFVTKADMRDRIDEFSSKSENSKYVTTGGSSGIPFGFYRDELAFSRELASKAHQYHRIGWREGDRQLVLRGLPIETPDHVEYVEGFEELRCSSYFLTTAQMDLYYRRALEYQPRWLRCYPSAGYIFARFLHERGLSIPSIEGVLCASENLYDFQKELLRQVFGSKVFSHYGHYELAVLAGYCEHEADYHVLPQYGIAELIDADGQPVTSPGSIGEIVGTSFLMYSTPFIRYRTGDLAVLKGFQCDSCKRPYQIWKRVEGRLQEFIVTGSGRMISMTAINMHDDTFDDVAQFQFHQSVPGKIVLRYIPKLSNKPVQLSKLRSRLLEKLGADVELKFEAVSEIPLTGRGKHRFLIQEIKLEHGDV